MKEKLIRSIPTQKMVLTFHQYYFWMIANNVFNNINIRFQLFL